MFRDLQTIATEDLLFALQEAAPATSGGLLSLPRRMMALNLSYQAMALDMQKFEHPYLMRYVNTEVDPTTGILDRLISHEMGEIICLSPRLKDLPTLEERNAVLMYRRAQGQGGQNTRYIMGATSYEIQGGQFRVLRSGVSQSKYRIWYQANVPLLHYGAPATGTGSTTTIYMNTAPTAGRFDRVEDAYVNTPLYIISGPGAGSLVRIDSIDHTTKVATCVSMRTVDGTVFTATPTTSSVYCVMPVFPPQFYDLWIAKAAGNFLGRLEGAQTALAKVAEATPKWNEWLQHHDSSSPIPINDSFPSDMGTGYSASFGGWITYSG